MPTFIHLATELMPRREQDGIRGIDRELSRFRCHLAPAAFADKDIVEIGSPDIREWLRTMSQKEATGAGLKRKLSRSTISRCMSLVSAVFLEAIERELITVNPCLGVKPKKRVDESDTREKWAFLLPWEQRAIAECAAIPVADRVMIRFAIGTGLRQGEQRYLEIPDLVVVGPEPHVLVRYAGRRIKDGVIQKLPPKSGKRRKVPLFGDGLSAAREWLEILPTYAESNPENLVFPTPTGRIRQQGKFFGRSDTLRKYYVAAGITLRPHLHHHALRHTMASNLVSGVLGRRWTLEEIRPVLGHSSTSVTERYAHLSDDALRQAVAETQAAISPLVELAPLPEDTIRDLNAVIPDAPDTERTVAA